MRKITSRIKLIGLIHSILLVTLIVVTIFLNQQTKNDGFVVNIAGKERMLSQKMAKELLFNLSRPPQWQEFDRAWEEFSSNLYDLRLGNAARNITPPPNKEIKERLDEIHHQSDKFFSVCGTLKHTLTQGTKPTQAQIDELYTLNITLLSLIDETVHAYTVTSEIKKERLELMQYVGGSFTLLAVLFTVYLTWRIDDEFSIFLNNAKHVGSIQCEDELPQPPHDMTGHELEVAGGEFKIFLSRVEKVVIKAQEALNDSQVALAQLENSSKIMEDQLNTLDLDPTSHDEIAHCIDKNEDLAITSLDDIASTKAMLEKFQATLKTIMEKMG